MKRTGKILSAFILCSIYLLQGCNQNSPAPAGNSMAPAASAAAASDKNCYDTTGINQSPIDIVDATAETFTPSASLFKLQIEKTKMNIVKGIGDHPNITVGPATPDSKNFLSFHGDVYQFIQFHFHDSGEHAINSVRGAMEMHVVFQKAGTNNRIIIGVPVGISPVNNPFIDTLWAKFSAAPGEMDVDLNSIQLQQMIGKYYTYTGSLTSPTYQEGATWIVSKEKMLLSRAQVDRFRSWHIGSAHGIQPVNNRIVLSTK